MVYKVKVWKSSTGKNCLPTVSNVWWIENQKPTHKQTQKPANKTKTKTKQNKQRENFKLLLQRQFSLPLRMSVHRQWVKRDLGLLPTSTVHVCCHGNRDLRKSRHEQLRCERREPLQEQETSAKKCFAQQMKQTISAQHFNRSEPCPVIGPQNSRLPLDQSDVNRKLTVAWSLRFW